MKIGKYSALAFLLTGCLTSGGGDSSRIVALGETGLVGKYVLVDYLYEYSNGQTYNPAILKIEGDLSIQSDSAYSERFLIGTDPTPHDYKGRVVEIRSDDAANGRGGLKLSLDQGDSTATSTSGLSTFSFRGDTLVLVTSTQDGESRGFKETDYFKRDTVP